MNVGHELSFGLVGWVSDPTAFTSDYDPKSSARKAKLRKPVGSETQPTFVGGTSWRFTANLSREIGQSGHKSAENPRCV